MEEKNRLYMDEELYNEETNKLNENLVTPISVPDDPLDHTDYKFKIRVTTRGTMPIRGEVIEVLASTDKGDRILVRLRNARITMGSASSMEGGLVMVDFTIYGYGSGSVFYERDFTIKNITLEFDHVKLQDVETIDIEME